MTKLHRLLTNFLNLSNEQKAWIIPLYLLSGLAWLATKLMYYRRMGPLLGIPYRNTELVVLADDAQKQRAWRLGKLVTALCKYTPWPSKCLVQAMVTRFALCCYGIPHVMYIGICKPSEAEQPMPSHAWLCVDRWVVTGGEGHKAFKVIATYVSSEEILTTAATSG